MRYISFDPSGNFKEGKGDTGWVIIKDSQIESFGQIRAKDFNSRMEYWEAHTLLIKEKNIDYIVTEDFRLYKSKAHSQTNSEMETSKLLGYLEMYAYTNNFTLQKQMASQAKSRFKDKILIHKGFITKDLNGRTYINGVNVSRHIVDALRHGLFHDLILKKRRKQ